ncbi:MAG TPA: M48 family metalloprotease [Acidobacteriota bacterium]|nr:M48 family metalloprotease [Acidobacteriota bacterium]HQM61931.1 M48 family metalloprotease [Acidobacteriota bacterium]
MGIRMRLGCALLLLTVIGGVCVQAASEYSEEDDVEPAGTLILRTDESGDAEVDAWLRLDSPGGPARVSPERLLGLVQLAVGQPLADSRVVENDGFLAVRGKLRRWAVRDGLVVTATVRISPLQALLRDAHQPRLELRLGHPRLGWAEYTGFEPSRRSAGAQTELRLIVRAGTPAVATATVRWGYDRWGLWWRLALAVLAVLAPLSLILIARRRSLRLAAADPIAAWFGFWRTYQWVLAGGWLAWLWLVFAGRWGTLVQFLAGPDRPVWLLALALPPALAGVACFLPARAVFRRVRGIHLTPAEMVRQEFWRQLAFLAPATLGLVGLVCLFDETPVAWLCFGLALLSALVGLTGYAWATGMTPHQLMSGELRDRMEVLARQAGVTLRRIFVMPAGRLQIGNAYALRGSDVILTDYLLERLNRAETDAVIAHELGHLKRGHHRLVGWVFAIIFVLLFFVGGTVFAVIAILWRMAAEAAGWGGVDRLPDLLDAMILILAPLGFGAALWGQLFVRRRCERSADRAAVALTGDPESAITALVKLSRMNLVPIRWGFWDEQLGTHPATLRRAQTIAADHAIPAERLDALLLTPSAPVADGYPVPEEMRNPQRLFTAEFKSRQVMLNLLVMLGLFALAPALWFLRLETVGWTGTARWLALGAGPLVVLAVYLLTANFTQLSGYGAVRRQLAGRLRRQGVLTAEADGEFVGLAPEPHHRLYEGHSVWDVGFLAWSDAGLAYAGDQCRFLIPRDEVAAVAAGAGPPGLLRTEEIRLHWRGPDGRERTWRLTALGGASRLGNSARSRRLRQRLAAWLAGQQSSGGGLLTASEPPPSELDEVRGDHPRRHVQAGGVIFSLVVIGCLAAGAATALGIDGWAVLYTPLVAAFAFVLAILPMALYRDR